MELNINIETNKLDNEGFKDLLNYLKDLEYRFHKIVVNVELKVH